MAIAFACRGCGQHYCVEDALAGKPTECHACRERTIVPTAKPKPALLSFGTAPPPPRPSSRPTPTRDLPTDTIYSADELEFHDEEPPVKAPARAPKAVASGYDVDPTLANPGRAGYVARDEGPTLVPPGMTRRFTAYLIDRLFIVAATFAATALFVILSGPHDSKTVSGFVLVTLVIVSGFYLCLFPATPLEGTPGKAICGLKIVTYSGERIGLGRSIWRGLSQFFIEVRLPALMRNVMAALMSADEMTLYDCLCDTRVVRSR